MKRLIAAIFLGIGLASCNKEPQPLTKEQIKRQIDSIAETRMKESDEMAKRDLQTRMKIEVKVKADSILYAMISQKTNDTAKKKTQ